MGQSGPAQAGVGPNAKLRRGDPLSSALWRHRAQSTVRATTFLRKWPIWYKRHIANVSITPVIIANLAYMNTKKHGELLEFICI